METELNNRKDKFKYLKITTIICLIAVTLSFAGCGANGKGPSTPSTGSGTTSTHGSTIIKGSEGIPEISVSKFFTNVWKNTGIYKMIHTPTAEVIALEMAQEEAVEEAAEVDVFADTIVPGWQ